jgi:hypothetical protein
VPPQLCNKIFLEAKARYRKTPATS